MVNAYKEYDGIVIGAGHNGMILQGYLLKAGLSVAVVERHLEVGGGLDAHENSRKPGFWHNMHSVNHRAVPDLPWFRDLDLASYGQEYIRPDVAAAILFRDKTALCWHNNDVEKTVASIARFNKRDAETFAGFHRRFSPVVKSIIGPETFSPPMAADRKRELLEKSPLGQAYYEFAGRTINEVLKDAFEDDRVRAMIGYLFLVRGNELDQPGQGYVVPVACAAGISSTISRGTSHRMAHTLNQMVVKNGGEVYEGQAAAEIILENGRAVGVRLADGRVLKARKFVASTLNPQQTFLELIDANKLEPWLRKRAENFRYSQTTPVATVHIAMKARPDYLAAQYDPDVNRAWLIVMGVDSTEDVQALADDCYAGRVPSRLQLIGGVPTIFDPTQAPPGCHTAFWWQLAPYHLKEGPQHWDEILDDLCRRELDLIREFSPNINTSTIADYYGVSPLDIERHLPNMRYGDWMCGELSEDQFLDKRPFPECSRYRTTIPGLYLAGSCCHPGGNITGAPAYNAANIIAQDQGVDRWWKPHDLEQLWNNLPAMARG